MSARSKKFYPKSSTAMNHRKAVLITVLTVILALSLSDGPGGKAVGDKAGGAKTKSAIVERYSGITITDEERHDLAAIIYLEARNQPAEGQQAIAEVIFNRVISDRFPNTVHDVIRQGAGTTAPQFSTISMVKTVVPKQEQYDAISAALYGSTILPADVVYFSLGGENSRTWGMIGDHVFSYQYSEKEEAHETKGR